MDYLCNYNLSNSDIEQIEGSFEDSDILEFDVHERNICKILDFFKSKGIVNLKQIIMEKTYMFYTKAEYIINKLDGVDEEKLLEINTNVDVLDELL